jgi:hypothetical protein
LQFFFFSSFVCLSSLNVGGDVDLLGQRSDSHLEAILDRFLDFLILIIGNERNRQALGTETAGTGDTMEVSIGVLGHVIVEDNVDTLNIHPAAEQVGGDQDAALEVLEQLVPLETLFLVHRTVNVNGGKVLLFQQGRQGNATLDRFDEDDDLVELQRIQQIEQLAIFLRLAQFDVVLLETVQGQLGFIINEDFEWLNGFSGDEQDTKGNYDGEGMN